jgi:hypothetical protein
MKKPSLITMSDLWDHIELLQNEFKKVLEANELHGTLLLTEIVTDLRCNYNWLIEQINQGNLKAYYLQQIDRKRGGFRVERKDYEEFKRQLQYDPAKEEFVYFPSIESIVEEFQLKHGLKRSKTTSQKRSRRCHG